MKRLVVFCALVVLLSACAPPTLYYWDDYSDTLYALKNEPNEAHLSEHIESLQSIIKESGEKNKRVPPGIYAELGYWLAKAGRGKESVVFFQLEMQTYPESKLLMDNVIAQANASNKKGSK